MTGARRSNVTHSNDILMTTRPGREKQAESQTNHNNFVSHHLSTIRIIGDKSRITFAQWPQSDPPGDVTLHNSKLFYLLGRLRLAARQAGAWKQKSAEAADVGRETMKEKPLIRKASFVTASLLIIASLAALPGFAPPAQAENGCSEEICVEVDPNPGSGVELPNVETTCSTECTTTPVNLIEIVQSDPEEVVPEITIWELTCVLDTDFGDPTFPLVSTQDQCPLGLDTQDSTSRTFGPVNKEHDLEEGEVGTLTTGPCKITGNLLVAGFGIQDINTSYPCASFET